MENIQGKNISPGTNSEPVAVEEHTDGMQLALSNLLQPNASPDDIPQLKAAKKFGVLFILLKELSKSNLTNFWVKIAILLLFSQETNKTAWTSQELDQDLHWLQKEARSRIISQLVKTNWLIFQDSTYQMSALGKSLLTMLVGLMDRENTQDSLDTSISSLTLAEISQSDPTNTLRMFLNELTRIDQEIQSTLESKSEHHLRKASSRIRNQFSVAIKSREHLENLPTNDFNTYRLKQEVHERLSAFHARLSQIQRAQNDMIARKIILADQSLTQHDIAEFLVNADMKDLVRLGKKAISYPVNVLDFVPQLMVYETEWYLEKERSKDERRGWTEMELANESQDRLVTYSRFLQFTGEVNHALSRSSELIIEQFIPYENWTTSAFRFCMLSVLESGEVPANLVADEAVACPKLKVAEPDGVSTAVLNDDITGVKEITRGIVTAVHVEGKK